MRGLLMAAVAMTVVGLSAGTSQAQQYSSVPIDTNALVIKPVNTITNIASGTFRYVSQVTANTLNNNQMLQMVNKLFGTKAPSGPLVQSGLSPLPDPRLYPSTYYRSPIQPVMPKYQVLNLPSNFSLPNR